MITVVCVFLLWVGVIIHLVEHRDGKWWYLKLAAAVLWLPALSVGMLFWPVSKANYERVTPEVEQK